MKDFLAGTGVPTLNRNDIHKLWIAIPEEEEQIEIVNILDEVINSKKTKEDKLKSLEKLKKSLMQNLLTGKVRIPLNELK